MIDTVAATGKNALYYGDNLQVLRDRITSDSIDLVYLDPPFNSNRSYNVLFKERTGNDAQAQIEAFDDSWTWSQQSEDLYDQLIKGGAPARVADALEAMRRLLGDNDVLAYLVMMTARLVELHRALKATGSLYLHCDSTASHYLKIMLDSIFGPTNFRNEIVWKRFNFHADARRFGRVTDRILFYTRTEDFTFNGARVPYSDEYVAAKFTHHDPDGRRYRLSDLNPPAGRGPVYGFNGVTKPWRITEDRMLQLDAEGRIYKGSKIAQLKRYLDELDGQAVHELWDDVSPINPRAAERLGYPTQKPMALLERVVAVSSNPDDVVLDPFCGCGTTIDAAQKLGRRWIGIDITYLAIDLIDKRLRHTYGDSIVGTYVVHGIPHDLPGAQALFAANPFDFERWAVSQVDGQPNERQVGDRGSDGVIRFPLDKAMGRVVVSVKGGKMINPAMVRDLQGTVQSERADMGVLILMGAPTKGMVDAVNRSGTYTNPISGTKYPRLQIITVPELLAGNRPKMPTPILPYIQAQQKPVDQGTLL